MKVVIRRWSELKKENAKLWEQISVELSPEEKTLVQKFGDAHIYTHLKNAPELQGLFSVVKVDSAEDAFSKFAIRAHIDDGKAYFYLLTELKENAVARLKAELGRLKILEQWESEEVITS